MKEQQKSQLPRFVLPITQNTGGVAFLSKSQMLRRGRHYSPKFSRIDRAAFLARFKKLWFKKTVKKEPLVVAMCAATMGKWNLLKHVRPEDLMYGAKAVHIKRDSIGHIVKLHPTLFKVLDIYFRYNYRGQMYPFESKALKPAAEYRFGTDIQSIEAMEITLESTNA